jgi:hypothetical protein
MARSRLVPTEEEFNPERYRILSAQPAFTDLRPLEPNLLGELFVLEWVKPKHEADTSRLDVLRKLAWSKDAIGMSSFLRRTAADFPAHVSFRRLALPPGPKQQLLWLLAGGDLIDGFCRVHDMATARQFYDEMLKIERRTGEHPVTHLLMAYGAFRLINSYSTVEDLPAMWVLYRAIVARADGQPDLHSLQAESAINLIKLALDAGELIVARETYDALAELAELYPEQWMIRNSMGDIAPLLIRAYGDTEQVADARQIYEGIVQLARDYPDEPDLRRAQAQAAVELIQAHDTAAEVSSIKYEDVKRAGQQLYDTTASISADHPDEPVLRLWQVLAGVLVMTNYIGAENDDAGQEISTEDYDAAQRIYRAVSVVVSTHSNEPGLREALEMLTRRLPEGYFD